MTRVLACISGKGGVGKSLGYSEFVSLASGDSIQIGPYIDKEIENNKLNVKKLIARTVGGRDEIFEILEPSKDLILDTVSFEDGDLKRIIKQPLILMRKPAPSHLIRIKTNSGTIDVTPEHKFLVMKNGFITKVAAEYIKEKEDYVLYFNSENFSENHNEYDLNVAELLGYIIGDGYMEKYKIHVFSDSSKIIENNFIKVFGSFKKLKDKRRKSLYRISFYNNKKVMNLYNKYGVKISKSDEKEVPLALFKASNECLAVFIRALFDCDAHVDVNKRQIEFVSKSKKLTFQISSILRSRFNISSQIKSVYNMATNGSKIKREYWKLLISSSNIEKYYHNIGFKIKPKMNRLKKWVNDDSTYNTNIEVFPIGTTLKKIRERNNLTALQVANKFGCTKQMIYEYEWNYYALSRNKLSDFIKVFDSFNIIDSNLEKLRNLTMSGFSFRTVVSKERIKYDYPYVYDFQISEEGAHFIHGTGIVVSNTTTVTNLGLALVKQGYNIIIMDANVTTPNLSLHLGIPFYPVTLHDVLKGNADPMEALYEHSSGLKIIPASLSTDDVVETSMEKLNSVLLHLLGRADIIIIDAAAGLGKEALSAMNVADEIIVVTNPELPAVTDALKTIKMAEKFGTKVLGVVVNRHKDLKHEMKIEDIESMLETRIISVIPEDIAIPRSIANKTPVIMNSPSSRSAREFRKLASKVSGTPFIEKETSWIDRMFSWMT